MENCSDLTMTGRVAIAISGAKKPTVTSCCIARNVMHAMKDPDTSVIFKVKEKYPQFSPQELIDLFNDMINACLDDK